MFEKVVERRGEMQQRHTLRKPQNIVNAHTQNLTNCIYFRSNCIPPGSNTISIHKSVVVVRVVFTT